jgi:SAM-dependent methyltransferase
MTARSRGRGLALAAAAALLAAALWWRRHPSACPYGQRFWVEAPHPLITRDRLREALEPWPGERVLEVGPGTGYYTLDAADWIAPGGRLDIFDLQQDMLDHTMRRAGERGLTNIAATRGDARELPYPDASFDAAFLVTVLGEIPDQDAALRELARVLKPGGRLVIGELFGDPHWVSPARLRQRAGAAGLAFNRRSGTPLGYFARLDRPEEPQP